MIFERNVLKCDVLIRRRISLTQKSHGALDGRANGAVGERIQTGAQGARASRRPD